VGSSIKKFFLNRDLLILFIVSKVAVILLTIFFYHYFDSLHSYNTWNRWYSRDPDLHPFFLPFSNWDGQHYLLLADYGYIYWQHSQAFFPLFPKCIQFLHFLVRDFYLSAFLVNIIFSYLFLVFFYHYAGELTSRKSAWKCALLVLSYPSAFFLTVFYSEAVFLFLLFGFLYCPPRGMGEKPSPLGEDFSMLAAWSAIGNRVIPFMISSTISSGSRNTASKFLDLTLR
jgi:hypothetical protein